MLGDVLGVAVVAAVGEELVCADEPMMLGYEVVAEHADGAALEVGEGEELELNL